MDHSTYTYNGYTYGRWSSGWQVWLDGGPVPVPVPAEEEYIDDETWAIWDSLDGDTYGTELAYGCSKRPESPLEVAIREGDGV